MTGTQYQTRIVKLLQQHFVDVHSGWSAFKNSPRKTSRLKYAPRVDIGIGPINDENTDKEWVLDRYDRIANKSSFKTFIKRCHETHVENLRTFLGDEYRSDLHSSLKEASEANNKNPRCLLSIEIEDQTSVKHKMGSLINAASLGMFGIGIGYEPKGLRTFLRHTQYFAFLKSKEKGTYETANFMALDPEQFIQIINASGQRLNSI